MSEVTLFRMAMNNYKAASTLYERRLGDELELNLVGYHLQQSVELCLKHVLEVGGFKYPKTHNIGDLLILIEESDSCVLRCSNYILDHEERFTEWKFQTCYVKSYSVEDRKIAQALPEAKKFLDANNPDKSVEMEVF